MKLVLSLAALGFVIATSASAAERVLECRFSDNVLQYEDVYLLSEGGSGRAEFKINGEKSCWAGEISYSETAEQIAIRGSIECVDGGKGELAKTLDLASMEMTGGWATHGCEWKQSAENQPGR